jgi:DNA-binding NtrC family response regulator
MRTVSPKRVLVVDDEPALIDVIVEHLIDSPYIVETATNGADALAAVARDRPDVVLLDIKMPGLDGMDVLKEIRRRDPSIAVIMVSGLPDVATTAEALRHGAFGYVPKPFDLRYLKHLVAAGIAT